MKDYRFLQQKFTAGTYVDRGLTFVRGEGVYLYDQKGERYLDMMTNYGVNILGYHDKDITEALTKQLEAPTTLHGSFNNDVRAEATEALIKRCGSFYTHIYWSNSGAEANEAALKFAVMSTGKKKIIACSHGYHGKTLGALSVTAGEKYRKPFLPLLWDVVFIPHNDPSALEQAIDDQTAAFIVEPIQGEGGIHLPDPAYLSKVREICTKRNILLIIDEIQTGMGRTGQFLSSQAAHIEAKSDLVEADILTLGKGLAGGIPVGATLINQKVATSIFKGSHSSTFGGNPLACAGVLAMLHKLDDSLLKHVEEMGNYFIQQLKNIQSPLVEEVRGKGLMIGMEVPQDKRNMILKKLQEEKVLAVPAGEDVVRFLPSFIIEREHVDMVVEAMEKVLTLLK